MKLALIFWWIWMGTLRIIGMSFLCIGPARFRFLIWGFQEQWELIILIILLEMRLQFQVKHEGILLRLFCTCRIRIRQMRIQKWRLIIRFWNDKIMDFLKTKLCLQILTSYIKSLLWIWIFGVKFWNKCQMEYYGFFNFLRKENQIYEMNLEN